MRFAIRDDDTNFFTSPEEIEHCYGNIWHEVAPSLCLISKVKGNWQYWVHQIYKDKKHTDWKAWEGDDMIYPIEQNQSLVQFIREKIGQGKLDIGFHAIYHRNGDERLPEDMSNNYVRGAEFYTNCDLTQAIVKEVAHLNELFDYHISVFTPPQNLLSIHGYKAVINAGLNICGGGITFHKKEKTPRGILNIAKIATFKAINRGKDYPYVLNYDHHNEIAYHYPLQPDTRLESLIRSFEMVRSFDGDFVLSTHYAEFNYPMTYDSKKTMKNILEEFMEYIGRYNVNKVSLSQLLTN